MASLTTTPLLPGGIHIGWHRRYSNVPIGDVPYVAMGQDVSPVSGTLYVTSIFMPSPLTIKKIYYLVGTGASGSVGYCQVLLWGYHGASGQLLAISTSTGSLVSGNNLFQALTFNNMYHVEGPGVFWVGLVFSDANARFRAMSAQSHVLPMTDSYTGGSWNGTNFINIPNPADTALPTTFVADVGPFIFVEEE